MKNWFNFVSACLFVLAVCLGCTHINEPIDITSNTGEPIDSIIFVVPSVSPGFVDSGTKADLVQSGDNVRFAWASTDTVGIYPNQGSQVFFSMVDGAGTNVASFDGGGWSLRQNSTYFCYFPFIGDIYLDRNNIPVSFIGQKQVSTSSFSNSRLFLASDGTSSNEGSLRFTFSYLNTIIKINATLPAGSYTKASLIIDEPLFVAEGSYSLNEKVIHGISYTKYLDIELEDFVLYEESTVPIFITSAPVNLQGKEVKVRIYSDTGVYECVKTPSRNYEANKWYYLTCAMEKLSGDTLPDNPEGAVDLGLSVQWASCNVGANAPSEYGHYFAWGEILPKTNYDWSTYEWGNPTSFTKYCSSSNYGGVDNLTSLELCDDAAAEWKGIGWRTPSFSEVEELITECDWEWTDSYNSSGVRGFIVRGKKEGFTNNHIFLPAGGFIAYSSYYWFQDRLLYWTRDLVEHNKRNAWYLIYYENKYELHDDGERRWGKLIRPVYTGKAGDWTPIDNIQLDYTDLRMEIGEQKQLHKTINPSDATARIFTWSSSDESIATVDQNGVITAIGEGRATISVSSLDGNHVATCSLFVGTYVEVANVRLNKTNVRMLVNDTMTLEADVEPANATEPSVIWSSSNSSIVDVDQNGVIRALQEGQATITVSAGSISATCVVNVFTNDNFYIHFADELVESICLSKWDTDNNSVLSYDEAAAVNDWWSFYDAFKNTNIVSFEELQFFTGLTDIHFYNCSSLNSIILPESATNINIQSCGSLTSITFPESVTSIARLSGTGLTSITIPHSVTTIGNNAFSGSIITTVDLSQCEVSSIPQDCFSGCKQLNTISLPQSVTSIEKGAFLDCSSLTTISIPQSVTTIADGAFRNCSNLTTISIPQSLTKIGQSAFENCSSLTVTISLPQSVTSIGKDAFKGCSSLTTISIPQSVTTIADGAFQNCSNLTTISIPQSVTTIGRGAFGGCSNLTSTILLPQLTTIGQYAFKGCSSLTAVDLSQSAVSSIPDNTFQYCSQLNTISLPQSVTSIGQYAFNGCSSLTTVDLSQSAVSSISNNSFEGCSQLNTISLPQSVTSIGQSAFNGCKSLTTISLPQSLTNIGNEAFNSCSSLISIDLSLSTVSSIPEKCFAGCTLLNTITLPQSISSIGNNAFYSCSSLTNILLPQSITSIGNNAFKYCKSLTTISLPQSITSIEQETFAYSGLSSIALPESITSIGPYAFRDCNNLSSITFSQSVTTIGNNAFVNCSSLTTIDLSQSAVSSIPNNCFSGCNQLNTISLPQSVTSIENSAFYGFSSLTNISLPQSLTSIGQSAFQKCSSMATTISLPQLTTVGQSAFYGCKSLTTVDFSQSAISSIPNNSFDGCSQLNTISLPQSVTSIGQYAFNGCSSLTNISLPQTLTTVGQYAFNGCSSLTAVNLSQSAISSIPDHCFSECSLLNTISLPQSVTSIGKYVFADCNSLSTISLPQTITSIGTGAFSNSGLSSITLPESITIIAEDIFKGCHNLPSITIPSSVTTIKSNAFAGSSISSFWVMPTIPPTLGTNIFSSVNYTIYVPAKSVNTYKEAWSKYAKYISPMP